MAARARSRRRRPGCGARTSSPAPRSWRTCSRKAQRVAAGDASVLIQGESGTGKELLARAIHRASPRANQPFVAINCGAIPGDAAGERALRPHRRARSPGAIADQRGLFVAADKGTLFLDEIGDMPLALQVKLLRVIETREVRPIGATRSIPFDVRIISATHRDLAKEKDSRHLPRGSLLPPQRGDAEAARRSTSAPRTSRCSPTISSKCWRPATAATRRPSRPRRSSCW